MPAPPIDTQADAAILRDMTGLAEILAVARRDMVAQEQACAVAIGAVHPTHRGSATNLVHYLALRQHDLRPMHKRLAMLGLSSLGRTEAAALASVDAVLGMLSRACGSPRPGPWTTPAPATLDAGRHMLDANAHRALGPRPTHRAVRVMVTMPSEAATDPSVIPMLMSAGMNIMRINCAHDGPDAWMAMIRTMRAAERAMGVRCLVAADLGGPKVRIGALARAGGAPMDRVRTRIGDAVHLMRGAPPDGVTPPPRASPGPKRPARVWCTAPAVIDALTIGHRVWFDDGAMGGVVEAVGPDRVTVRMTHAPPKGSRLRPDKGINVPDAELTMPALTQEDLDHLSVLVDHADAFGLSFAHRPEDVVLMQEAIAARTDRRPTIVLKIETRSAFGRLPEMVLALARWEACAIMIARGDLAVECGYERLSEVQEEIIWVAEACHIPAIWATQVLETLAHTGVPTRAEITDAAMGQRAECVMLNKGPYIAQAITVLDDILRRMESHQRKKTPVLRPLKIAAGAPDALGDRDTGGGV